MLIEDDAGVSKMLRTLFTISKIDFLHADTGKKGLELLEQENIGVIICDIMLPDIVGYDILKYVRQADRQNGDRHTPFMFLTAFADPNDVRKGLEAGADRYITKPFSAAELLQAVKTAM